MRYLSKIIFIHSANIPYAEVMVDGNVHFTGTQGVGKSTLLRAILFFYNADPQRLGIRNQGQKKFDQFYLPNNNSYIIYQVEREGDSPFSVIVSRQNARAVFRFADGAFSKDWLIDESGRVTSDPAEVRRRLQKQGVDISNIISTYTEYKDIIYGNYHSRSARHLERYHLLRSPKYENLPRIIQNVFLNERVDADFIKETIIQSISNESETTVNVKFFRNQLSEFSQEYNDIRLWSKKNRKGEIETVNKAQRVIDEGNAILANRIYQRELCGQLNYAVDKANEEIPKLKIKIAKAAEEEKKILGKRSGLQERYDDKHQKLTKELGSVEKDLKKATDLKSHYLSIGIDTLVAFEAEKPLFEKKSDEVRDRIATLTQKAGDVNTQFNRMIDGVRSGHESTKATLSLRISEYEDARLKRLRDCNDRRRKELGNADKEYENLKQSADATIAELNKELHQKELRITEARHSTPFAEDIKELVAQLDSLTNRQDLLRKEKTNLDTLIEKHAQILETEELRTESQFSKPLSEIDRQISATEEKIRKEEDLLKRSEGSLIDWLETNVDGWEDSIGKIADEGRVLYNRNLSPSMIDEGRNAMFGVNIDLSQLSRDVRTPMEIKDSLLSLQEKLDSQRAEKKRLLEEKEECLKKLRSKVKSEIKAIDEKKKSVEGELLVIPGRIDRMRLDLEALQNKSQEKKDQLLSQLNEEKSDLALRKRLKDDEVKAIKEKKARALKQIEKTFKDEEWKINQESDSEIKGIKDSIETDRIDSEKKIMELQNKKAEALKKKGVDTKILSEFQREFEEIKEKLRKIEENRDILAEYRINKRDYLDRENEFRQQKKSLTETRNGLTEGFLRDKEKYDLQLKDSAERRKELEESLKEHEYDLEEAADFTASSGCPEFLKDIPNEKTGDSCRIIIRNLREMADRLRGGIDSLKKSVNLFRQLFSPRNTFKFPVAPETDEEYLEYSESVKEFVSNDKIRDFQEVSNHRYKDILAAISRDYSTLMERESEIRKIINEVNYDFSHKTFAGVIRLIELRLDKSETPMVRTLQEIHDFWTENSLEIGETNLFSTESDGDANQMAVRYLERLSEILDAHSEIEEIRLTDNFSLKLKIDENDNTTGWIDNMKMVGSDGTDILVKAIINILLINVFKQRTGKNSETFRLHCMMDEIGKLADENIRGILRFANERNIFIVNSAPKAHSPLSYRRLYLLTKNDKAQTIIRPILSTRQSELQ